MSGGDDDAAGRGTEAAEGCGGSWADTCGHRCREQQREQESEERSAGDQSEYGVGEAEVRADGGQGEAVGVAGHPEGHGHERAAGDPHTPGCTIRAFTVGGHGGTVAWLPGPCSRLLGRRGCPEIG
ncbi:hypothetical protein PSA01_17560 [Pseudonocardia saturnea]|uniref:Uncharacterized protein n=1 Tax=Pseudonocardia saturnea TaxID=33909 RepID=A0ABQ0RVN9_9PSEU|nr:hypothetical protein Pdca_38770 [Pseudonocardia autotrophica]GEC24727.1 hypothetical protein PSA01_17560 [Pseudonocardia saturnea]